MWECKRKVFHKSVYIGPHIAGKTYIVLKKSKLVLIGGIFIITKLLEQYIDEIIFEAKIKNLGENEEGYVLSDDWVDCN